MSDKLDYRNKFKALYLNIFKLDKLLIAGIDPGTVGAYAILDLEGNLIDIASGRDFNKSKITLEMVRHGKIIFIGCDVYQAPSLTKKLASSIGAKVITPDHDLKYLEKIKIVGEFLKSKNNFIELNNKHEKDALAAALYGLKRTKSLLKKIEDHLKQNNKMHLFDQVKRKVLLDDTPIVDAVRLFS